MSDIQTLNSTIQKKKKTKKSVKCFGNLNNIPIFVLSSKMTKEIITNNLNIKENGKY